MAAFSDRKLAWLVYTVLFGMVPIFMRLSAFALVNGDKIPMFSASDFISLGIVLHVSLLPASHSPNLSLLYWPAT